MPALTLCAWNLSPAQPNPPPGRAISRAPVFFAAGSQQSDSTAERTGFRRLRASAVPPARRFSTRPGLPWVAEEPGAASVAPLNLLGL
jgi:hypothetical protein